MPGRGEVLALRRAIGFLPGAKLSNFVVVQADRLSTLETVVVIPLDEALADYTGLPGLVAVARAEAGTPTDQVAIVPQVTSLSLSRFEARAIGKLQPEALRRLGRALRMVLELS